MMDICTNAEALRSPKKNEEVTLKSSVKIKVVQKDKGPMKALQILPDAKERRKS